MARSCKSWVECAAVQKPKYRRTFLGIKPGSIALSTPNFDKAVGFNYPQPSPNFK